MRHGLMVLGALGDALGGARGDEIGECVACLPLRLHGHHRVVMHITTCATRALLLLEHLNTGRRVCSGRGVSSDARLVVLLDECREEKRRAGVVDEGGEQASGRREVCRRKWRLDCFGLVSR